MGPHASLDGRVIVGERCRIEAGARIGQRGHGYTYGGDLGWVEKAHNFGVVLGDNVYVGANTCIDRGSWRDTRIGNGTKIDNLVHVAHNVQIGVDCMIIAQSEISGSVVLGDRVYLAPGALIRERLTVGSGSIVGMGAVVVKDVDRQVVVAGVPARVVGPVTDWPPPPPRDARA